MSIAEYIIKKLKEADCYHVAGIPGTSCAGFFDAIDKDEEIDYLITTSELEAGYIADGYGRTKGIGAVSVSYGVGTLSMVNAVASAYTERVPMIVINGGPTSIDIKLEKELGTLYSHSTGKDETDLQVFNVVTEFAEIINGNKSPRQIIDKAFKVCLETLRPVYIEIPSDKWDTEIGEEVIETSSYSENNSERFVKAIESAVKDKKNSILFVGSEVSRMGLTDQVLTLIEKWNIPFVTTALAKSCISEDHPNFIGCYDSDLFHQSKFEVVDKAEFYIAIGCIWGIDHRAFMKIAHPKMAEFGYGCGRVGNNKFDHVHTSETIGLLTSINIPTEEVEIPDSASTSIDEFGHTAIFNTVNDFISDKQNIQIVIDTCLGSFPGADIHMPEVDMYLGNPVWLSIGQGAPASIGSFLASKKRPIIITGDGGFQIVATTFSTMVKYKVPALIIVLDNGLYAIEQYLLDSNYFNEPKSDPLKYVILNGWDYSSFPAVYSGGLGKSADNAPDLLKGIEEWANQDTPMIIGCKIPRRDLPST